MKAALLTTLLGITLSLTSCGGDAQAYPLKTCVVSGEELGGMGQPVKVTHEGTEVQLCCKSCIKDFEKEPAKFAQMVKDAAAKK